MTKALKVLLIAAAIAGGSMAHAQQLQETALAGAQDQLAAKTMNLVSAAALKAGLDALKVDETVYAQAVRDVLPEGSLDRHILQWTIGLSGLREVSSREIAEAMNALPDWPNKALLQRNFERALWREGADSQLVLQAFANAKPKTVEGMMLLVSTLVSEGKQEQAQALLSPYWRTTKLDPQSEKLVLGKFSEILTPQDHLIRMQAMLYAERTSSAELVADLAKAPELHAAWLAVYRGDKQAKKLIDAVPKEQQANAGFLFAKLLAARKARDWPNAASILASAPKNSEALIDPDRWWSERRLVTRALLDQRQYKLAYVVAAGHFGESPEDAAEAAFHAGWLALRYLKKADLAKPHFEAIITGSKGAQSLSRGYYWLGRTLEAQKLEAKGAYVQAAHYGTTFYGQLAAAKLKQTKLDIGEPQAAEADVARFEAREAVAAIRRLDAVGHGARSRSLFLSLAEEIENTGEIALLAKMASVRGDHFTALKVGKIAAARGLDVGGLSHPVGAIPAEASIGEAGAALAYSIARQESEFNTGAVSRVGALGLLQLMPETAAEMAKRAKLPFDQMRLTSDAAYNATLGTEFLSQQIDRFDGSYILTFAGYNAGPSRSKEWIKKYGDPRGKDIDFVVDWIERIPFSETRQYVQKIMENYQVYKARLGGRVDIERDLTLGRQS